MGNFYPYHARHRECIDVNGELDELDKLEQLTASWGVQLFYGRQVYAVHFHCEDPTA